MRRGIRIMQIRLSEAVMRGYRGGEDIERYKAGKTARLSEHLKLKREEKGLEMTPRCHVRHREYRRSTGRCGAERSEGNELHLGHVET